MNSPVTGLRVACAVFGLISMVQLLRLVAGTEVLVAGHSIPLWASGVAFLVSGALSVWMGRLSSRGKNMPA
jgi:hypothetical protein